MLEHLDNAVRCYRLGMDSAGSKSFVALLDLLGARMLEPNFAAQVTPVLGEMMAAQQRADFLYLADLLEVGVRPQVVG